MKKYIELTEYGNNGRTVVSADSIHGLCRVRDGSNDKEFTELIVSGYPLLVNEPIDEILEKMERENDTMDVKLLSVIEDIKAEIEHEGDMYPNGDWYISIDRVCEIFDKHTKLPKNLTNGDIWLKTYGGGIIDITNGKVYVERAYFPFDEEWWNSPYKEVEDAE